MAKKSSVKKVKQAEKRSLRNRAWKSRIKNAWKKFQQILETGKDKKELEVALREMLSLIDRATSKGIFHPNKAARLKSKIHRAFNLKTLAESK
ncbi:MAG: 30S ribosomal protein S20 [Caldiserica bacterium]|nr:30S ribosomal protein S20 [Caldisericota bacterium]